jgi:predicted ArsR family transcriptional regulator
METNHITEPRLLARRSDPITSHEAARRVGEFQGTHYTVILKALKEFERPAGACEIAQAANLTQVQVCKRLPELARAGLIQSTEKTCKTPAGRSERLWRLA